MEEEKKLYPMKFVPIEETEGENVQIADLGYMDSEIRNGWLAASSISEIMEMYMDRVVGEGVFGYYGRQFPVTIKFKEIKGRTALMVHPDDVVAEERFDFLGKSKLWYVLSAAPGSRFFLGFKRNVSSSEFYEGCQDGTVESLLNPVEVRAGDSYFIYPGLVHAAEGDMTVVEISESSPLDFRLFTWDDGRPVDDFDSDLTLEAAFDFIDYSKYSPYANGSVQPDLHEDKAGNTTRLTDNPEFTVHEVKLKDALHVYCEKFGSFVTYTCLSGEAVVQAEIDGVKETYSVKPKETILIPVEVPDFFLMPAARNTVLLETMVEAQDVVDQYIASDVDDDAEASDIDGSSPLN